MVILGGLGSLRGAVVGAAAFVLLKEVYASEALLGPLAGHWPLALGLTKPPWFASSAPDRPASAPARGKAARL